MRALWFINNKGKAAEYYGETEKKGGWIFSLQDLIEKDEKVELGIVFYSNTKEEPFEYKGTKYFPVKYSYEGSKIKKTFFRYLHKTEYKENLNTFLNIAKNFKPDIIHIHGTENPFGLIIPHINIPCVVSIQGILTVYTKKFFSGISSKSWIFRNNLKTIFLHNTPKARYMNFYKRAIIEQEILRNANHIFGRTNWDKLISKVLSPNRKYYHIDRILRDEFYQYIWNPKDNAGDTFRLFSTSGPNEYKGLETIYETAKILISNNVKFEWYVAGINHTTNINHVCKKLFKKRPEQLNIKLLGSLKPDKLITFMKKSSCYIQVSHIENSPNSLAEAMLIGMPCIASFAGGTPSLLVNNEEGILYQDGDSYYLSGLILELINDENKRKIYSQNARKKALVRHDPQKIYSYLINSYKNIIEDEKAK